MSNSSDSRVIVENCIIHAVQITMAAVDEDESPRDFTLDEIESMIVATTRAVVHLRRLPGGQDASDRILSDLKKELGTCDAFSQGSNAHQDEALKLVKRVFGDDVDLSYDSTGYHFVMMVSAELEHGDRLRDKMIRLAAELRP